MLAYINEVIILAKSKAEPWLEDDGLLLIAAWARDGLTDEQIAHNVGVTRETLRVWKGKYPAISAALKKGKEVVDIEVENALHKKALGYTVELKKTFKVRISEYDPDTGRKTSEHEELQTGIDEVHIPADTTAQIFWLKNRKPEQWRDKREVDTSLSAKEGIMPDVLEALKNAKANVE